MSKERLKILTMLEEDSITSNEAIKLLKAIDSKDKAKPSKNTELTDNDISHFVESMMSDFKRKTESISRQLSENLNNMDGKLSETFNINFENMINSLKSLKQSLESIICGMESRLAGSLDMISSKLMEEASNFSSLLNGKDTRENSSLKKRMEDIEKKLKSTAFDPSYLCENISNALGGLTGIGSNPHIHSHVFRKGVTSQLPISMEFAGANGSMAIEGYDGSEVEATVYVNIAEKPINQIVDVTDEHGLYSIKAADGDNSISISINVKIPKKMIKSIRVINHNGKIGVSDICCETLICTTTGGKISLSCLECKSIECSTSEGRIQLSRIRCDKLFALTNNSPITIDNTYCNLSDIINTNGNILLEFNDMVYGHNEYKIENENAGINVELAIPSDCGVYVDAFCQNGNVNIQEIPGFSYEIRDNKSSSIHILGETKNYRDCKSSISIIAQSTNSDINIR